MSHYVPNAVELTLPYSAPVLPLFRWADEPRYEDDEGVQPGESSEGYPSNQFPSNQFPNPYTDSPITEYAHPYDRPRIEKQPTFDKPPPEIPPLIDSQPSNHVDLRTVVVDPPDKRHAEQQPASQPVLSVHDCTTPVPGEKAPTVLASTQPRFTPSKKADIGVKAKYALERCWNRKRGGIATIIKELAELATYDEMRNHVERLDSYSKRVTAANALLASACWLRHNTSDEEMVQWIAVLFALIALVPTRGLSSDDVQDVLRPGMLSPTLEELSVPLKARWPLGPEKSQEIRSVIARIVHAFCGKPSAGQAAPVRGVHPPESGAPTQFIQLHLDSMYPPTTSKNVPTNSFGETKPSKQSPASEPPRNSKPLWPSIPPDNEPDFEDEYWRAHDDFEDPYEPGTDSHEDAWDEDMTGQYQYTPPQAGQFHHPPTTEQSDAKRQRLVNQPMFAKPSPMTNQQPASQPPLRVPVPMTPESREQTRVAQKSTQVQFLSRELDVAVGSRASTHASTSLAYLGVSESLNQLIASQPFQPVRPAPVDATFVPGMQTPAASRLPDPRLPLQYALEQYQDPYGYAPKQNQNPYAYAPVYTPLQNGQSDHPQTRGQYDAKRQHFEKQPLFAERWPGTTQQPERVLPVLASTTSVPQKPTRAVPASTQVQRQQLTVNDVDRMAKHALGLASKFNHIAAAGVRDLAELVSYRAMINRVLKINSGAKKAMLADALLFAANWLRTTIGTEEGKVQLLGVLFSLLDREPTDKALTKDVVQGVLSPYWMLPPEFDDVRRHLQDRWKSAALEGNAIACLVFDFCAQSPPPT